MKPATADSTPLPAENQPKVPSAISFRRSKSSLSQQKTDESSKDPKQSKLPIRPKVQREQSTQQTSSLVRSLSTMHSDSRKSITQPTQDNDKKNLPHALGSIPSYLRKKIGTTGGGVVPESRVILSASEVRKQLERQNSSSKSIFLKKKIIFIVRFQSHPIF